MHLAEKSPGWSKLLLDGLPDPVYVADFAGRTLDVNRAAVESMRCTRAELLSTTAFDLAVGFTPDLYALVQQLTGAGNVVRRREYHRRRDGVLYPTEVHVRQVRVEGQPLIVVTERALDERLPSDEELGVIAVGELPRPADAVVSLDRRGAVAVFAGRAEDVFEVPAPAVLGKSFERFCTPALRDALAEHLGGRAKRRLAHGAQPPVRAEARRGSGERFPAEVYFRHLEAGGQPLVTMLVRDLSDPSSADANGSPTPFWEAADPPCLAAIVGRSAAMARVRAAVRRAADSEATVLISGETGTGKELVASALHQLSQRRSAPFVAVNSAALPPGLIESELFGHERGAYTGAVARRIGRFESAEGGTLFLDEIGDLSLDLQAKLLRVLQERRLERLGGERSIAVDVRVIAATHRDLRACVREGRFRADLYYRLNVLPIHVPPLRTRREDIPDLVQHFVRELSARYLRPIGVQATIPPALETYEWPGNVRELRNLVERAAVLSPGGAISVEETWDGPTRAGIAPHQIERERILQALERTGWRVGGAHGCARLLGLNPSTLESRMRRLGIRRPRI